ncbi:MAG: GNAT family N-acetyltransferase [Candidatus Heimdallarchaeota archaeon]|nr:GNAT family N-acetyltransferase [Candidatus Heimdallarchaeota archaeon]
MQDHFIFREATDQDAQSIKNIMRYAFEGHKNQYEDPEKPDPRRDLTHTYPTKNYVIEENGSIAANLGVIQFQEQIRGTFIKMAGITGVACKPEYRRSGYMKQLFEYVFKLLYEQEYLVSTLYPFKFEFYEGLGYGQMDSLHVFTLKTSDIIQKPTPNRIIQEDFDPNYKRCQPLYDIIASQLDGLAKRESFIWKSMPGWTWRNQGYQFICQDKNGKDLGYIILRFEKADEKNPFPHILVREMVYFDSETKQAFLNFLANHDSQREFVKLAPFEHNILPYLRTPRMKENRIQDNSMFRIINLNELLLRLNYPNDVNEMITFQVTDPASQCPWNNKTLTLKVENGKGQIVTSSNRYPIKIGIKELSQIVIGFYDPFELFEAGLISGEKHAFSALGQIFPKQNTALREYF